MEVLGQSGLGKSTFLNSLFLAEVHDITSAKRPEIATTVNIEPRTVRLVENDVRLDITFVDCPGFGDLVDNSNW
jgi:septin family protein